MTSAMISQLLGVLVDSDRHPILLHCVDGTSLQLLRPACRP